MHDTPHRNTESQKRGPFRVTFETNPDHCNIKCPMCDVHSPLRPSLKKTMRMMDPTIIHRAFDQLKGTRFCEAVTTPMGEPFVYPHLNQLVDLCERDHILLHITTNGTFPRDDASYWAERLTSIGADMKFSINGATEYTQTKIMPGASLSRVAKHVALFAKARDAVAVQGGPRSRLTLKVTFQRGNVDELPDLVRFAYDVGFDRIRGSHLYAWYPGLIKDQLNIDKESRQLFQRKVYEAQETAAQLVQHYGRSLILSNFVSLEHGESLGPCPYLGDELWIYPDGSLHVCCVPAHSRPSVQLGTVDSPGLLSAWEGYQYQNLYSNYRELPSCMHCARRQVGLTKEQQA